tara:strand:- start:273 stop:428 length:156 start_codon:yes stop_codon:yes gene_type:complete
MRINYHREELEPSSSGNKETLAYRFSKKPPKIGGFFVSISIFAKPKFEVAL